MRLALLFSFIAATLGCSSSSTPTPTGAECPSPDPMSLTWDSFGSHFMTTYCTDCHDSTLKHAQRNGAPLYHDYDMLSGVLETIDHVDEYAGAGPAASNSDMPPSKCPTTPGGPLDRACPQPTDDERAQLSIWLACEKARDH
ncbi:MAG TPA: hypothetical protein VGC42_16445 [Kofleriaceae bacterium]